MRHVVSAALILVGIIHLLPLAGAFGASNLSSLYGVDFTDRNTLILMRHRAVLFGLLGVFFVVAGFVRTFQLSALILATVSVVSFLALSFTVGGFNANIARVVTVDWVAFALLLIGSIAHALTSQRP
jgi:hypothetical protein